MCAWERLVFFAWKTRARHLPCTQVARLWSCPWPRRTVHSLLSAAPGLPTLLPPGGAQPTVTARLLHVCWAENKARRAPGLTESRLKERHSCRQRRMLRVLSPALGRRSTWVSSRSLRVLQGLSTVTTRTSQKKWLKNDGKDNQLAQGHS